MIYFILLLLGIALIFVGVKSGCCDGELAPMHLMAFLWITVPVAGVCYQLLKIKYGVFVSWGSFDLFDRSTWSGAHWLMIIALVIYFLILFIWAILRKRFTYIVMLAGIVMVEYVILVFIVSCILTSDFFLIKLFAIFLNLVIDGYTSLLSYLLLFGVFLPFGDSSSSSSKRNTGYTSDNIDEETENDFSRMPGSIHTSGGKTYRLRQNFGYAVEYVEADNPNDVITISNIYSRTASEMSTDAGHFYF